MSEIQAGFGVSNITPKVGAAMVGYGNRKGVSTGVHDELASRALVVEGGGTLWALSSNEICLFAAPTVAEIREKVAARTPIPAANVFVAAVHTHSGPFDNHPEDWDRPLADLVADAIVQAYERRRPARIGSGRGRLDGHTINRRFIDRPTDPGMGVLRVENLDGKVLGLVVNWTCHPVVMGYDNLLISADFPGVTSGKLEERLGGDALVLYINGGTGNVNPYTKGVEAKLDGSYTIATMAERTSYFGTEQSEPRYHIGDRAGGTFEEVETLGLAVAEEAWKVAGAIAPGEPERAPWVGSVPVTIRRADAPILEEQLLARMPAGFTSVEVMALGVGEMALVGEPGEVFAETYVSFKQRLWQMGFGMPMAVSYANGFFGYMPPAHAFPEGGYEVGWARRVGLRENMQELMWQAMKELAAPHAATAAPLATAAAPHAATAATHAAAHSQQAEA